MMMVKQCRKMLNGRGKIIGGLSATALLTTLVGFLIHDRYQTISKAADRVPVIDTWIEEHKTWTESTLNGVLQKISDGASVTEKMGERINQRIDEKYGAIETQIVVQTENVGEWRREKNAADVEWRAEQRERNREMLDLLRKLEERSARP